ISVGRVKKIVKLDKDISRINSEAMFLISSSTELFLQFLAERSAQVAMEKKKRTVRIGDLREAVKRHRPTADFLLDCLPMPPPPSDKNTHKDRSKVTAPPSFYTKSIDAFFRK
ncbi:hypothetical protein M569_14821, partial [Genlisea aurea]